MLEDLIRGDWITETLANIASGANEAEEDGGVDHESPVASDEPLSARADDMWVAEHVPTHRTTKPMLFNDPFQQMTLEIPAKTTCLLVRSVELARLYGLLQDPIEIQLSKAALAKGLRLVWLHGRLRHLDQTDIERLSPDNQPFFTHFGDNHQPDP